MATRDAHVSIDDLLSHRSWVRGLAFAIARDPDAADDIEQQTWLTAMRSPPGDGRALRGWLGVVVRNVVRQRRRSRTRRWRHDGSVEIRDLRAGTVALRVAGRGHGAEACAVPVRAGELATVTIRLTPATLAGRLRSERCALKTDDQPLARALWEFAQRAVLPIRFTSSLPTATARRPVSIDLADATLSEVLEALCTAGNAEARIDEEAALLWIGPR